MFLSKINQEFKKNSSVQIGDATAGIVVLIFAIMLPARPSFWCLRSGRETADNAPSPSVLDWNYTQKNFQWNVLLLLGIKFRTQHK